MKTDAAISALAALAQETRLGVFRQLVVAGADGLTPTELVERLGVAPSTLSFHLKDLQQAGLVEAEPQGRQILYRAGFATMQALVDYLMENCCRGEGAVCAPAKVCGVPVDTARGVGRSRGGNRE